MFVQPVLRSSPSGVELLEFPADPSGLIASFATRFHHEDLVFLESLAHAEAKHHVY